MRLHWRTTRRPRSAFPAEGRVLAALVLGLFFLSVGGLGFVFHVMEEADVDGVCCLLNGPGSHKGDGLGGTHSSASPSFESRSTHGGHGHDCSSCPICSLFMSTVAVRLAGLPVLDAPVPLGREARAPEPARPCLRPRDHSRLRAPPELLPV